VFAGKCGKRKKALLSLSDAESITYDVIFLSSRLGARPNPLANWKHAIFYYWLLFHASISGSVRTHRMRAAAWLVSGGTLDKRATRVYGIALPEQQPVD
jgi:hypothetical protein